MSKLSGSHDIHNWTFTARKDLLSGGTVEVVYKHSNMVGEAPKLTFVVVSGSVRKQILELSEVEQIKMLNGSVDPNGMVLLLKWTNTMARNPEKSGEQVPQSEMDLIAVHHAVYITGW
jgi:hypothetical protein